MMRTTSLLFSVAINVALVVTLCLQLRSRAELGATMVRSVRPMVAPRVMNPSRVACNAKKAETGMVPDKNTRPDEDIVATDGSFFDKVFNEWITKKSPTRVRRMRRCPATMNLKKLHCNSKTACLHFTR